MDERTEIIESTPTTREVTSVPPASNRTTEVRTAGRPATDVDRVEAVAYDPYANRRVAAYRVTQLVYWIFGLVEGLIAIRFVLKALGANPSAGFAEFIYGISYPLVLPFVGLFGNWQAQGSILEVHSVVALIVYALLAWLLGRLVWILVGEHRSAVETRATSVDSRL
jgi:YggT family protein